MSLIYYGNTREISEHLLYYLKVLRVVPATQEYSGFYIHEKKYGYETQRKIALELTLANSELDDYLIYRYLTAQEIQFINSSNTKAKFHILLHKYLNAEYVKNNIQTQSTQTSIMVDYSKSSYLQSYHQVKKCWPSQNLVKVSVQQQVETENKKEKNRCFQVPVVILFLLKILFNPIHELRHFSVLLRYSRLRLLSRLFELFMFLDFLLIIFLFKLSGLLKVLLIKLSYGIKHMLLMCGFKFYGFFVDTFYFLLRGGFKFYGFFVDTFYFLLRVRHALHMTGFKFYGFAYDMTMMSYKFIKLVLLYPLRKAYWFTSFQYNKRIKKYFRNEA